jgi:hypothetical protein
LRRHVGDRPLEDLEERLLDALARHVARDRGVLVLAADLVDLVDVDDALLAFLDVAACRSFRMMFSTSSPTYPASVSVVASTMVKGTERSLASVWASSVLPVPVGPISRMLLFVSSMSFRLRGCF